MQQSATVDLETSAGWVAGTTIHCYDYNCVPFSAYWNAGSGCCGSEEFSGLRYKNQRLNFWRRQLTDLQELVYCCRSGDVSGLRYKNRRLRARRSQQAELHELECCCRSGDVSGLSYTNWSSAMGPKNSAGWDAITGNCGSGDVIGLSNTNWFAAVNMERSTDREERIGVCGSEDVGRLSCRNWPTELAWDVSGLRCKNRRHWAWRGQRVESQKLVYGLWPGDASGLR